jgi:Zn-dependent protease
MTLQHVDILFQLIVFLFAISVHESAHAWMANRRGDPTARMLGRVTLNPIKHIDPVGTVLLPLIAAVAHFPMIGWAKPTPVDPRNFKNPVLDDILTSVAGPVSNFLVAICALLALLLIKLSSPLGQQIVFGIPYGIIPPEMNSALVHFLPPNALRVYDTLGMFALMALVFLGGGLLGKLIFPVVGIFDYILLRI